MRGLKRIIVVTEGRMKGQKFRSFRALGDALMIGETVCAQEVYEITSGKWKGHFFRTRLVEMERTERHIIRSEVFPF